MIDLRNYLIVVAYLYFLVIAIWSFGLMQLLPIELPFREEGHRLNSATCSHGPLVVLIVEVVGANLTEVERFAAVAINHTN